jgi:two-component system CheB/CheR fusion protein
MGAKLVSVKPETTPRRRVLVVEDNLDSVHSMAMLIRMMGHEVQFAINGFSAIAVARQFRPQIILLDIGLPDFKGHIIAQQLKWDPGLEKVRIIALTGLPDGDELQQLALEAGCDEFYRKPLDPVKLEELLAKP